MERRTTQGRSRASVIFSATVVLPEADPPQRPMEIEEEEDGVETRTIL